MSEMPDDVVGAIGKASEALEYVERARGHLYEFHQLMGRADLEFGRAVELLAAAGLSADAAELDRTVVGRNVLDGRWTFQVVDEFDALYYETVVGRVRGMEASHLGGTRHVYERRMKEQRRSVGEPGHDMDPLRRPES